MSPPKPHRQVPAKVTAYVDEGIKELIEVLNSIDGVHTSSSCEGDDDEYAEIYMDYKQPSEGSYKDSAEFADRMKRILLKDDLWEVRISLVWLGSRTEPAIIIEMPSEEIGNVIKALSDAECALAYSNIHKGLENCSHE